MVVNGLERREHVLSIFLDLSKAFDCVHHETLLQQLEASGVRGLPLKWLSSYLSNRRQFVQVENVRSQTITNKYGVPQGSILGPTLFIIYVNSIRTIIQNGHVVQYADDTTVSTNSKCKDELEVKAFLLLSSCIQYFSQLNLQTNSSKSNVINFSLRQTEHTTLPLVMMDEEFLEVTESIKFLGMHLDQGLTWDDHIDKICAKVASGIFVLRNLAKTCSPEVLKMAYYGLIHPHISYGIRLWGGCSNNKFERVFKLQKKSIRIISKLSFRDSCRHVFRELDILTLPCLYMLEVALYCRSKCNLIQGRDVHRYGTRCRDTYRMSKHRTTAFERLPAQVGVGLLNRLPATIKLLDQQKFKCQLKNLFSNKVFYSVDEFMDSRWG